MRRGQITQVIKRAINEIESEIDQAMSENSWRVAMRR